MTNVYVNDNGNYGEVPVVFTDADRDELIASLAEAFSPEPFDPEAFMSDCYSVDLVEAFNDSDTATWELLRSYRRRGAFLTHADRAFADLLTNREYLDAVTTPGEIADEYGISDATVRQAIARDDIPARKSGGTWLITHDDAEARWGKRR